MDLTLQGIVIDRSGSSFPVRAVGAFRDLLPAWRELRVAARELRSMPTGTLGVDARLTGSDPSPVESPEPTFGDWLPVFDARARQLARAVERAARLRPFSATCLVRAIALHRLLEANGITGSSIHVGVRYENGRFNAHAWVERAGRTLGESGPVTRRYGLLGKVSVRNTQTPGI